MTNTTSTTLLSTLTKPSTPAPPLFSFGLYDIQQPGLLAKQMQAQTGVFSYWSSRAPSLPLPTLPNLPTGAPDPILSYTSGPVSLNLKLEQVLWLNALLEAADLYATVQSQITLTQQTTQDAQQNPQAGTAALADVNRRILEETYPLLIGPPPQRVNYFDRQFLRTADFQQEQSYHMLQLKLHNRLLHTPGVAEGLTVIASADSSGVVVTAGTAIDADGNELVLTSDTTMPITLTTAPITATTIAVTAATTKASVYISYNATPCAPSTDTGVTGNTRVCEQPVLTIGDDTGGVPAGIRLAELTLADGKVTAVDPTVRLLVGVPISSLTTKQLTLAPDLSTPGISLSYVAPTSPSTVGSLSISGADHIALMPTGNVGIGTITPAHRLDVAGDANVSGAVTAAGISVSGAVTAASANVSGNVGIGTTTPAHRLDVAGDTNVSGAVTAASISVSGAVTAASANVTGNLSVNGNQSVTGSVGVTGAITPSAGKSYQNMISTGATPNQTIVDGIAFPNNPGGGSGDIAYMRYYPRTGESCTLEIGIQNDFDDHIALMSSGNVGIGTITPAHKLDVSGDANVSGNLSVMGTITRGGQPLSASGTAVNQQTIGVPWGSTDNWSIFVSPNNVGCSENSSRDDWDNAIIQIVCYATANAAKTGFVVTLRCRAKWAENAANLYWSDQNDGQPGTIAQITANYILVAR